MNQPPVTLCVPTYNGERYLPQALASIDAQTYQNLDVVISDDASTDGTRALIEAFASRRGNVRVYAQAKNLGMTGNWDFCIAHARGAYVKFLFQDDVLAPTAVAALLERALETRSLLVACGREIVFEEGDNDDDAPLRRGLLNHRERIEALHAAQQYYAPREFARLLAQTPTSNLFGEPTCTLIETDALRRWGPFNGALFQICDADLFNRIALRGRVAFVPQRLATFRWHARSASSQNHLSRRLWTSIVEPARLIRSMLHDEGYAPFREALRGRREGVALRRQYNSFVHWGGKHVRAALASGALPKAEGESVLAALAQLPLEPGFFIDRLVWASRRLLP